MILMRMARGETEGAPEAAARSSAPRKVEFLGVSLLVEAGVLVPREETELLGTVALGILASSGPSPTVIDMCCGSGNLAVAIAVRCPEATVWASDMTSPSVRIARRNAAAHGLVGRLHVVRGDMFAGLAPAGFEGRADLIVCNPPYISTARLEGERSELLESEPREAFDGGAYGISILQRLLREAPEFLSPGGWLAFEFGAGQARQAEMLVRRTGAFEPVEFFEDRAGEPRVARARKRAA